MVSQLELPHDHGVRFIFPHAPVRPITLNFGFEMRAWFDITTLGKTGDEHEDEEGIKEAQQSIEALIEEQIQSGIPSERIILGGFSQGGAMALYTGLRYPKTLGGIVALSCYLPLADNLGAEAHAANKNIPIFMAHGEKDALVLPEWGLRSKKRLENNGFQLEWHTYDIDHSVCLEEINDVSKWLRRLI